MKKNIYKLFTTIIITSFILAGISSPVIAGDGSSALKEALNKTCENGHTLDSGVVVKEPTCTERGVTKYTCAECGLTLQDNNIPALGHQADGGEVHEATDDISAFLQFHCVRCGEKMGVQPISNDMADALKPQQVTKPVTSKKSGKSDKPEKVKSEPEKKSE
ncbi:MAG: hypothetical protein Q4D29_07950, partial [Lachnospiraceae bacterium]|nr:hypothetical protein [Lachnospiraceae bacterium]